jgi:hypothetical protein
MVVGFVNIPGIVLGIDDIEAAPIWVQVGYVSWLGTFVLYPVWAIWFARAVRDVNENARTTLHTPGREQGGR